MMLLLSSRRGTSCGNPVWGTGIPQGQYRSNKKWSIHGYRVDMAGASPASLPLRRVADSISPYPYEHDIAQRWWSLPHDSILPLTNGNTFRLLFRGYTGSSKGPDVRDAVLLDERTGHHISGDVEFHIHTSDWMAHQHQNDSRYNHVILHVVSLCDDPSPTRRQDGSIIPVCSLHDVRLTLQPAIALQKQETWPCHTLAHDDDARYNLLRRAGVLRFEQKTHKFVEQLHHTANAYDQCLLLALAEGLAYGRDRDFFRAVGLLLLGHAQDIQDIPEPLGRSNTPSPLDTRRLHVLRQLIAQSHEQTNVWQTLSNILASSQEMDALLAILRNFFCEMGLSLARADILLCNVVLPFAAAVALVERNTWIAARAQALYETHPGLPSNRISRLMSKQLLLASEPRGSCQQQGLHHIYQETCREKQCHLCIAGRAAL